MTMMAMTKENLGERRELVFANGLLGQAKQLAYASKGLGLAREYAIAQGNDFPFTLWQRFQHFLNVACEPSAAQRISRFAYVFSKLHQIIANTNAQC